MNAKEFQGVFDISETLAEVPLSPKWGRERNQGPQSVSTEMNDLPHQTPLFRERSHLLSAAVTGAYLVCSYYSAATEQQQ